MKHPSFVSAIAMMAIATINTSCIFYPSVSDDQPYHKVCKTKTKQLSLELLAKDPICQNDNGGIDDWASCLVLSGFIGSASAVVSGSIVIVGNSIHWMEYSAKC